MGILIVYALQYVIPHDGPVVPAFFFVLAWAMFTIITVVIFAVAILVDPAKGHAGEVKSAEPPSKFV